MSHIIPLSPVAADGQHFYLTPKEAAEVLRVSVGTLEVWRRTGAQDLRFYRRGRNILYDLQDLHQFMDRLKVDASAN
jgi:excisionase family DNA binding protein